jgi:hypothetical protein
MSICAKDAKIVHGLHLMYYKQDGGAAHGWFWFNVCMDRFEVMMFQKLIKDVLL